MELDYKLTIDELPENNGNGESNICIVFDLTKDCCLSKYIFMEDDETGEDCSYWSDIPEHQQYRVIIWAYLPDPHIELFDKYIQLRKDSRKNESTN